MSKSENYNGWKNYQTWNVSLWISNDEGLYDLARQLKSYSALRDSLREMGIIETPDGVSFNDSGLDLDELNEMIQEL